MAKKTSRKAGASKRPLLSDVMKARAAADAVLKRALADDVFREKLRTNPSATLRRAGIPSYAVEDLSRELVIDRQSLAGDCAETCHVTCWITCFITGNGRLPGQDRVNPV